MGHSSGIMAMIMGSGPVVMFVLLTLASFSIACWTIILVKSFRLRRVVFMDMEFSDIFRNSGNFEEIMQKAEDMPDSPMASLFITGYMELRRLHADFASAKSLPGLPVWLETLERALDKSVRAETASLESAVPVLATIGNSAPFIGLFGTVWGIMSSFQSIGLKGTATLATVAPGISEALVATAAGLAAAIPAVMAFNIFMSRLDDVERRLRGFSSDFLNSVERQLAVKGLE